MPNENPIDKDFLFLVECFKGFDMSRGKVRSLMIYHRGAFQWLEDPRSTCSQ